MAMTDPLGDMLTRIRNGQRAGMQNVSCPASKLRANVLEVLKREGYIRGFGPGNGEAMPEFKIELKYNDGAPVIREINRVSKPGGEITVELKYHEGQPVIQEISRISTPGRRVYSKIADLPRYYNGLGISILSTPRGVLSDSEARTQNVGGEVLCRVF